MLSNVYQAILDNDDVTYLQADTADYETAAVILNGTWDGDVIPYTTINEQSYPIVAMQDTQTGNNVVTVNPNGSQVTSSYFVNVRGLTGFGLYCNNWTSGTVTVQISLHRAAK